MKQVKTVLMLASLLATIFAAGLATAQNPTASRQLQLSAFGAASGVDTGLKSGKNVSITAGGDLGLPPWRGIRPTIEVRGTYPIDDGTIDSQESVLAGLKVDFLLRHRLNPYGDFLFGRGQINYGKGYIFGNEIYSLTTTYVDAAGGGIDYRLSDHFALKLDAQWERWGSAPTPSGIIYSTVGSAGVVYYFTFNRRHVR